MSYTALYRKFRPSTFEDVKGQDHIVTTLKNQIRAVQYTMYKSLHRKMWKTQWKKWKTSWENRGFFHNSGGKPSGKSG